MANRILQMETEAKREERKAADAAAVWRGWCMRCGEIRGTLADLRGHRCPDGTPTRLEAAEDGPAS